MARSMSPGDAGLFRVLVERTYLDEAGGTTTLAFGPYNESGPAMHVYKQQKYSTENAAECWWFRPCRTKIRLQSTPVGWVDEESLSIETPEKTDA